MNTLPRLRFAAALFGAATLAVSATLLAPGTLRAQTAVTDPVGYLSIALPANSDTFVSIPFTRPAEFTGAVASVDTASGKITLSGTPGFTAGSFAALATTAPNDGHKTYYAIVGPKNVALTPTLGVTNGSPAVIASGALPTDFAVGDTVTVAGYTFTIAAVSGTSVTLDRVFPGTSANGLAATYNHSPSEGRFYTVNSNDAGSLTVNLNGDSLSNVTPGTQVSVIPYWTLGASFPAGDAGKSFVATTSTRSFQTQIFIPDYKSAGYNLPYLQNYYYSNNVNGTSQNVGWRSSKDANTSDHSDDVLLPDSYFVLRNGGASSLAFIPIGGVVTKRLAVALTTATTQPQDNPVAVARPVDIKLQDLGLSPTDSSFVATTSTRNFGDQLYVYSNSQILFNKPPTTTYYFSNNVNGTDQNVGWRSTNDNNTANHGNDIIPAGSAILIRKAATANGQTAFWTNTPTY